LIESDDVRLRQITTLVHVLTHIFEKGPWHTKNWALFSLSDQLQIFRRSLYAIN